MFEVRLVQATRIAAPTWVEKEFAIDSRDPRGIE